LVFLALDAGTPIGLRLGVAVLVVVLAGISWLYVGALQTERSARVVQRALVLRHQRAVDVSELECSAEEARANGELELQVAAVAQLADLQLELGDWNRARELYEQVLQLSQMLGDRSREASVLVDLARCFAAAAEGRSEYLAQVSWGEASSRCRTARAIFRWELADPLGEARALECLGEIHQAQGRFSAAVMLLREALDAYRAADSRRNEAFCLVRLADASLKEGDVDQAAAFCSQSREVSRKLGDRDGEALALSALGDVRVSEGDFDDAMALYEEAVATYPQSTDRLRAVVVAGLGRRSQGC
jgi:tetratricopeptide (TPR) repeat protein